LEYAQQTVEEKTVEPDLNQQLQDYIEKEAETFYKDIVFSLKYKTELSVKKIV